MLYLTPELCRSSTFPLLLPDAGEAAFRHVSLVLAADGSCLGAAVVAAAAVRST